MFLMQQRYNFVRNDSDTDYDELSDGEINKLLIVTQTPIRPKKHGKLHHIFSRK